MNKKFKKVLVNSTLAVGGVSLPLVFSLSASGDKTAAEWKTDAQKLLGTLLSQSSELGNKAGVDRSQYGNFVQAMMKLVNGITSKEKYDLFEKAVTKLIELNAQSTIVYPNGSTIKNSQDYKDADEDAKKAFDSAYDNFAPNNYYTLFVSKILNGPEKNLWDAASSESSSLEQMQEALGLVNNFLIQPYSDNYEAYIKAYNELTIRYRQQALNKLNEWTTLDNKQPFIDDLNKLKPNAKKELVDPIMIAAFAQAQKDVDAKISNLSNLSESQKNELKTSASSAQMTEWSDEALAAVLKLANDYDEVASNIKDELNKENSLTSEQKEKLLNDLGNQEVSKLGAYLDQVNNLNTAMTVAKENLEKFDQAAFESTPEYSFAPQDKITAYQNALNKLKTMGQSADNLPLTSEAVSAIEKEFSDAKAALNKAGQEAFETAKTNTKNAIDQLEFLDPDYIASIKADVDKQTSQQDLENLVAKYNALDLQAKELIDEVAKYNGLENNEIYTGSDAETKAVFDTALNAAKAALNDNKLVNGKTNEEVTTLLNNLQNAWSNLSNQNFDNLKKSVLKHLDTLTNLTDNQKTALKDKINALNDTQKEDLKQIKQQADDLNTAMGTLKEASEKISEVQNDNNINYVAASKEQKDAYDTAASKLQNVLNPENSASSNIEPSAINQLVTDLNDAASNLNGQANYDKDLTDISKLENLTPDQISAAQDAYKAATNNAGRASALADAQSLNKAMGTLKDLISKQDQTQKDANYKLASAEAQKAYNDAITAANNAVTTPDKQNPLDAAKVAELINSINTALSGLNGNNALQQYQKQIDMMSFLNQAEIQHFTDQLNSAADATAAEKVVTDAKAVNDAMEKLINALNPVQIKVVKESQAFKDASKEAQDAYTSKINEAINKVKNNNLSVDDINALLKEIADAQNALDGAEQLGKTKDAIKGEIEANDKLNAAQKEALINQLADPNVNSISEAKKVQASANALGDAMQALKDEIAKENTVTNSQNYKDATNQDAYTTPLQAAKDALNTNIDATQAGKLLQDLQNGTAVLNGNNQLNDAKTQANNAIDALNDLNDAQKTALKQEVSNAANVADASSVTKKAQALETAMKALKDEIAKENDVKASIDYTQATNQDAYTTPLQAAKDALNTNIDAVQAGKLLENLQNGTAALNGEENQAKAQVNNSTLLTPEQKDAAIKQIEATNPFTAQNASDLYNSLLQQSKANATAKLDELSNLSPEQKQNYTNQIANATVADTTTGEFDANVANALANATADNDVIGSALKELDKLTNLTPAEKETLTQQISSANPQDVKTLISKATALNDAITKLNNDLINYLQSGNKTDVTNDLNTIKANAVVVKDKDKTTTITPIDQINNLVANIDSTIALKNALDNYLQANVSLPGFDKTANTLQQAIQNQQAAVEQLKANQYAPLQGAAQVAITNAPTLIANANLIQDLVKAIQTENADETKRILGEMISNPQYTWANDLSSLLSSNKYFDLIAKLEHKKDDKDALRKLENLIKESSAPEVVKSALLKNIAKTGLGANLRWLAALIPGVILFLVGLGLYLKKRK
ncbi:hypothetical protein [Mycoplasma seminis]|uniref:Extracellular matrix-binding protein ebh GA module domain-containing protein n=1 Tax=Mycoplasma seminis TaxID=512749 RepID=A0ABY9H9A1_9MOLU|nr:hypothetical protein [Mycoplasma seminis]WLP85165.1 hypothetical protein Q8852_02460 [Mycoplasma seminis]